DIIFMGENMATVEDISTPAAASGDHDYADGIFIMAGPHVKRNEEVAFASVLDITPTILYLQGLPVAADMDGKVLTRAFEESFVKSRRVRYVRSYEGLPGRGNAGNGAGNAGKETLEKLRSLGYVQ
ncbi:MAG: hypothetical protein ACYC5N_11750, partial [Endomicrobiales bacterium]